VPIFCSIIQNCSLVAQPSTQIDLKISSAILLSASASPLTPLPPRVALALAVAQGEGHYCIPLLRLILKFLLQFFYQRLLSLIPQYFFLIHLASSHLLPIQRPSV